MPFYGWYAARAGSIAIDRKAAAAALRRMVAAARQAAAERTPNGDFPARDTRRAGHAAPYQPGVAALYQALALAAGAGGGQFRAVLGPPQLL